MAATISTTQLQWDLAGLGYLPLSGIDGTLGPVTTSAVEAFQSDQCLSVDGIAGPQTDGALSSVVQQVQDVAGTTADGLYGPGTEAAVKTWQSQNNLSADGIAGPQTMTAMLITRNHQCGGPGSGSPAPGSSSGAQLQWDLAGLGYLSWSDIDGIVGPQTEGATQTFQTDRCLAVDGIAGPQTNGALTSVIEAVQNVAGTTADGAYGPNTRAAVASWQSSHGLSADGQAGPATMSAMGITRTVHCSGPPSGTPGPGVSATTQLQWDLAGLAYLPWSGIDGITGPHTVGATEQFQADNCLTVDGIAGPQTNGALTSVIESVQRVAGTTADGAYGPNTKAAVASWQAAHGLTADGQAGPQTMSKMGITRVRCTGSLTGTPPPGDVGNAIASVATTQLNDPSRNHEQGGYNCNFYSTVLGVGTGGCSNGWRSEEWCADFGRWVWGQAGVSVAGLNAAAASFHSYGLTHGTWHHGVPFVGDAVVFDLSADGSFASHMGLVVAVSGSSFTMISGNTFNPADGQDDIVGKVTMSDTASGISGFTDPVTVAPASNNQTAFNFFTSTGLSKVQAAGIVGNFDQESSMNPGAVQVPSGPGRGIAQWSVGGRWDTATSDNMLWYASQHGESQWALTPQLQFSWYELSTFSGYGLGPLRAATDINSAVIAFQNDFEKCSQCDTDNRIRFADQAFAFYG